MKFQILSKYCVPTRLSPIEHFNHLTPVLQHSTIALVKQAISLFLRLVIEVHLFGFQIKSPVNRLYPLATLLSGTVDKENKLSQTQRKMQTANTCSE